MTDERQVTEADSTVIERLRQSIVTASNDDLSKPMTDKRSRHVERVDAMQAAIYEIDRLAAAHVRAPVAADGEVEALCSFLDGAAGLLLAHPSDLYGLTQKCREAAALIRRLVAERDEWRRIAEHLPWQPMETLVRIHRLEAERDALAAALASRPPQVGRERAWNHAVEIAREITSGGPFTDTNVQQLAESVAYYAGTASFPLPSAAPAVGEVERLRAALGECLTVAKTGGPGSGLAWIASCAKDALEQKAGD